MLAVFPMLFAEGKWTTKALLYSVSVYLVWTVDIFSHGILDTVITEEYQLLKSSQCPLFLHEQDCYEQVVSFELLSQAISLHIGVGLSSDITLENFTYWLNVGFFSLPKGSFKNGPVTSAGENEQSYKYQSWEYQIMIHTFRGDSRDSVLLSLNSGFGDNGEERKHWQLSGLMKGSLQSLD